LSEGTSVQEQTIDASISLHIAIHRYRSRPTMGIFVDEETANGADVESGLGSLTTPLISQQSTETVNTDDSDETTVIMKADFSFALAATALLVIGGVSTSAAAMLSAQTISMYVAGGVCILNAPWVAVKQYAIAKVGGLRLGMNQMMGLINLLQEEERILKVTVDDLLEEVECLIDIQKELDDIASEQGYNTDEIVSTVNENESLLKQMQNNLREVAIADITRIVLSSDRDGDMNINLKELNELTLRLELTLKMRGIDLDGEAFKTMVRKDNDISHVLKVIEAIMFEETIDGKEVDEYADEARQDEVRQDDLVGMLAASVIGRIRRLANSTGSDEVDETPMFTLQDIFTQGSVSAARGTRVSLSKGMKGPSSRTSQVMRQTVNVIKASHILQQLIEENHEGIREGFARDQNMRELNVSLRDLNVSLRDLNASPIKRDSFFRDQNMRNLNVSPIKRDGLFR